MESKYDPDEFFNRKPNVIKFKCAVCGHLTPIQTQDLPPLLWRDDLITTTEFMTHSGGNGYELHFRTPDREKYLEVQEVCRKVIDHGKPQTNADRIRQMSDEEMAAEFIVILGKFGFGDREELLDWLKSDAKEK